MVLRADRQALVPLIEQKPVVFTQQPPGKEVHRRRADKAGHEAVDRPLVDLVGRGALVDDPVFHHHHAVAEGHRLFLVVRDVHGGRLHAAVERLQLRSHADAQLGVQVRERLVEQKGLRIAHDRAPDRHALALSAGERLRPPLQKLADAEDFGRVAHAPVDLAPLRAGLLPMSVRHQEAHRVVPRAELAAEQQPERHVLVDRHVRVEGVILKDHRDVAVLGRDAVDDALANANRPRGDVLEPRDHPQRRALAAAGGADEHDEFAVADLKADVIDGLHVARVDLAHVLEDDFRHDRLAARALKAAANPGWVVLNIRVGGQRSQADRKLAGNASRRPVY